MARIWTPVEAPPPGACAAEAGPIRAAVNAGAPGALDAAQVVECRLTAGDATWAVMRLEATSGTGGGAQ